MYRSRLEERLAHWFELNEIPFTYESITLPYTVAANYKPDFILENGVILEAKGYLKPGDRRKMLCVRDCNPDKDIRLVFQAPNNKLNKDSSTTYSAWAEKHGFQWCHAHNIPMEWLL
jgi:hypothetical protein